MIRNFKNFAFYFGCTAWFVSDLVRSPDCLYLAQRFSQFSSMQYRHVPCQNSCLFSHSVQSSRERESIIMLQPKTYCLNSWDCIKDQWVVGLSHSNKLGNNTNNRLENINQKIDSRSKAKISATTIQNCQLRHPVYRLVLLN